MSGLGKMKEITRFILLVFLDCSLVLTESPSEGGGECGGHPIMVSRREWRAREPWLSYEMLTPVSHVIIQHTVTQQCFTKAQCSRSVQFIQDFHMDDRGFFDVGYNFLVGGDGRVYVGRGFNESGAHSINFNTRSIGVAFIGNYMVDTPSKAMLQAAQELVECGVRKGHLSPVVQINGHRDVSCTLSPGDILYAIIRKWKRYKGGRIKEFNCSSNRRR